MPPDSIRVLVVDDSAVICRVLKRVLEREEGIEVVATAGDPYEARERIVELKPDVVTLDLEMPGMDGLTFLQKLMAHFPVPVVICSHLTRERFDLAMHAMELGAIDVVNKPSGVAVGDIHELAVQIVDKVKAAAAARGRRGTVREKHVPAVATTDARGRPLGVRPGAVARLQGESPARAPLLPAPAGLRRAAGKVIVIGGSTGGPEALQTILERLPAETPPILVVQHMPEFFTLAFANRLNGLCEITVKEAEPGDRLRPGLALIAPGNMHLLVRRRGAAMVAQLSAGALVCRHRPSVEVLFQSAAKVCGPNTVAVLLSGMGADGATGMLELKNAGARTIAQNEASSVVFGMPREAIRLGAADRVESLDRIAQTILDLCCER